MGGKFVPPTKQKQLWGAVSSLVFNKSLTNLAVLLILGHFFQCCWWIFTNLSMSKVEKKNVKRSIKKGCENWSNDHQRKNSLIFYQIPQTYTVRKCIEISWGNLYVDISYWGTLCSCCTHLSLLATSSLETKYNSTLSITITSLPN